MKLHIEEECSHDDRWLYSIVIDSKRASFCLSNRMSEREFTDFGEQITAIVNMALKLGHENAVENIHRNLATLTERLERQQKWATLNG